MSNRLDVTGPLNPIFQFFPRGLHRKSPWKPTHAQIGNFIWITSRDQAVLNIGNGLENVRIQVRASSGFH